MVALNAPAAFFNAILSRIVYNRANKRVGGLKAVA